MGKIVYMFLRDSLLLSFSSPFPLSLSLSSLCPLKFVFAFFSLPTFAFLLIPYFTRFKFRTDLTCEFRYHRYESVYSSRLVLFLRALLYTALTVALRLAHVCLQMLTELLYSHACGSICRGCALAIPLTSFGLVLRCFVFQNPRLSLRRLVLCELLLCRCMYGQLESL